MKKMTYYFPNEGETDAFFGSASPVCVDMEELKELANGWGVSLDELLEQVHEATEEEMAEYGCYDR